MASARLTVSLTETRQFRRLVQFVDKVEEHAEDSGDEHLRWLVDDLRDDLLEDMGN